MVVACALLEALYEGHGIGLVVVAARENVEVIGHDCEREQFELTDRRAVSQLALDGVREVTNEEWLAVVGYEHEVVGDAAAV